MTGYKNIYSEYNKAQVDLTEWLMGTAHPPQLQDYWDATWSIQPKTCPEERASNLNTIVAGRIEAAKLFQSKKKKVYKRHVFCLKLFQWLQSTFIPSPNNRQYGFT